MLKNKFIKKLEVLGISALMAVMGNVSVFAASASSHMYANGYKIYVDLGTVYNDNPEYCFVAVNSSNQVDIDIYGRGYCPYGYREFRDYCDQDYALLAGTYCAAGFDGVTSTVTVWADGESESEYFECWN